MRRTIGYYQRQLEDQGVDVRARVLEQVALEMVRQRYRRLVFDELVRILEHVRNAGPSVWASGRLRHLADLIDGDVAAGADHDGHGAAGDDGESGPSRAAA